MAAQKKSSSLPDEESDIDGEAEDYPEELLGFAARLDQAFVDKLGEDYKQTEVARLTGVSQPSVSNLLKKPKRKKFQLATVLKLAKGLDISLDVLLLGKPDPWKIIAELRRRGGRRVSEHEPPATVASPPKQRKKIGPPT